MTMLLLLVAQVDFNYSQKADASFPRVVPNKQQHFEYESIVVSCERLEGLTGWRVMRKIKGVIKTCSSTWSTSTGPCTINNAFPAIDSGEYWCEMGVKTSNTVNITVTAGSVILESPVLPVMEGEAVTLSCRQKQTFTNLTTQFFKDGHLMVKSSTGIMTINVSKSFEGLYKCRIPGVGESPESWLAVRADSTPQPSPQLSLLFYVGIAVFLVALLLLVGLLHYRKHQTITRASSLVCSPPSSMCLFSYSQASLMFSMASSFSHLPPPLSVLPFLSKGQSTPSLTPR
ncbi:low affinity immunoglobulin gamma Fc region receptor II-a-like [Perca flavescens]|uniref:low affinity immunoglobulin gamma Fc region receptor II-a-like n=1 Tax=Perca flavescens TaxID=8167 RepID=UPI00106DD397|nr:low affinity immunoglobulin gamma Fc region receptor II-a-like [Perca flavescens]